MTREEAIEILKCGEPTIDEMDARCKYNEAIDMAIEALEQEPCEDAISRQAAIDLVSTMYLGNDSNSSYRTDGDTGDTLVGKFQVMDGLSDLPAITQSKECWIPISEKLPEEFVSVLVCYKSQGGMAQCVTERIVDFLDGGTRWSGMCGQKPIAWMSLPEPYRAESEVENANR